jgi:hypothetical protein
MRIPLTIVGNNGLTSDGSVERVSSYRRISYCVGHTREEVEDTLSLSATPTVEARAYQKWVGPSTTDDSITGDVLDFGQLPLGRVGKGGSYI